MNNKNFQYVIFVIGALVIGAIVYLAIFQKSNTRVAINQNITLAHSPTPSPSIAPSISPSPSPTLVQSFTPSNSFKFSKPIERALERVTKKPFGIKISPKDSPVSPEKFSGYHTGVDFETFSDEKDIDIAVYAICSGPLVMKKYASGYGGVAVQSCNINNEDVTVIYGHLRLSSIATKVHQTIEQGKKIGVLGMGYSAETNGERKHLHLGIHKGKNIVLLGYAQKQEELNRWIDALTLLK